MAQFILSDEEISYIVEALNTEAQEVQTDVDNRKARGLNEGYRLKYLKGVEAIRGRLLSKDELKKGLEPLKGGVK